MRRWGALIAVVLLLLAAGPPAQSAFELRLARVDQALESNPSNVSQQALTACRSMRDMAVKLYRAGHPTRAERRLKMCEKILELRR